MSVFAQGDLIGAKISLYGCSQIASNYSVDHTYSSAGRYVVTISATNLVSNKTLSLSHNILVGQTGLTFQPPAAIEYGVVENVKFITASGTFVWFNCSFNGDSVQAVYNETYKQGYVIVPASTYPYVGNYLLDLTYDTTITNPLNVQITIPVEIKIVGFAIQESNLFLTKNQEYTYTMFFNAGTNVNISIDWNDTSSSYDSVVNASHAMDNV